MKNFTDFWPFILINKLHGISAFFTNIHQYIMIMYEFLSMTFIWSEIIIIILEVIFYIAISWLFFPHSIHQCFILKPMISSTAFTLPNFCLKISIKHLCIAFQWKIYFLSRRFYACSYTSEILHINCKTNYITFCSRHFFHLTNRNVTYLFLFQFGTLNIGGFRIEISWPCSIKDNRTFFFYKRAGVRFWKN